MALIGHSSVLLTDLPRNKIKNKTNHTQAYLSDMEPKNNMPRNHPQRHFLTEWVHEVFDYVGDVDNRAVVLWYRCFVG